MKATAFLTASGGLFGGAVATFIGSARLGNWDDSEDDAEGTALLSDSSDGGKWVTVNGRHIFIEDGDTMDDAIKKLDSSDHPRTREKVTDKRRHKRMNIDEMGKLMNQRGYTLDTKHPESGTKNVGGEWKTQYAFKDKSGKTHVFSNDEVTEILSEGEVSRRKKK